MAKTDRMPYLCSSFPRKSPAISGSFAKRDLQLEASYLDITRKNVVDVIRHIRIQIIYIYVYIYVYIYMTYVTYEYKLNICNIYMYVTCLTCVTKYVTLD